MKRQTINYSWPAILSDFSKDEVQGNFTRGKLKVFYVGETADHRKFSKEFADNLVKTLKYTPVVSQYNEEEDDFVGHAPQQQIYGIVDPCVEPSYEMDDEGKEWCVCDVVFYTERPDKVGEIAKKIAGHKHSLELDPKTVKYVVNYDEKKHFQNIEFTAGKFVGVSVLGTKQKPAFTGSEFFEENSDFSIKMNILKNYIENASKEEINPAKNGGEHMDFNEFMKLSYGEISLKVEEAICKEYENDAFTYLVDFYEDNAIVRFFYYLENTSKLMRVYYSCDENGNVTLGGINEVHITYEDVEQVQTSSEDGFNAAETEENDTFKEENAEEEKDQVAEAQDNGPEVKDEEEDPKDNEEEKPEAETECKKDENEDEEKHENCEENTELESNYEVNEQATEDTTVENADSTLIENESAPDFSEESVVENETSVQENNSSSASFTESEREELENLKREKKINLINSFKDSLTEDELNTFLSNVDNFEESNLELELLKKFKEKASVEEKPMRVFTYSNIMTNNSSSSNESELDKLVRKNLRK